MNNREPVDTVAQEFLASHFAGEVSSIAEIGRGEWSRAYAFRRQGREYVARFSAFDEDFRKDAWAARFRSSDLPNGNLLVSRGRIAAALDWGSAKFGDFLYDVAWFSAWAWWYPKLRGIDFRQEAAQHYAAIGLDVPHFAERLRCYELHIYLESQVYNAFQQRWEFFDEVAQQIVRL